MSDINIGLNTYSLLSPYTGIGVYTRNLVLALQEIQGVDLSFFYGHRWSKKLHEGPMPGMNVIKSLIKRFVPHPYTLMRSFQQHQFDNGTSRFLCDLYHEPSFIPFRFDGPTVITVHDLSPILFPETHPLHRVRHFNEQFPKSIKQAAAIIVDTEFVRKEIIAIFGISPQLVNTIHLGVSGDFRPRSKTEVVSILDKYDLVYGHYVLAVGTLEPRKNLIRTIEAYSELSESIRKRIPLVIAGMKGWLTKEIESRIFSLKVRDEVRWLGYIPSIQLPLLYSAASMLVYPSLYEGFGLPVLEAMASGIPVITSDRSPMLEVSGDVAIMIDPGDTDLLRSAMHNLLEDRQEAINRGTRGIERAHQFSWKICAEKTLKVYRSVISGQGFGLT